MARRETNRVPLPLGPANRSATAKDRTLAKRVADVERATGLVSVEGQAPEIIQVGGGSTTTNITNNYVTNVTGGGGSGTIVTIGGTGEVVSAPGMPTTLGTIYGHAVGAALRSTLSAYGEDLVGVYTSDGSGFRPLNNLTASYSTGMYYSSAPHVGPRLWPDFDIPVITPYNDSTCAGYSHVHGVAWYSTGWFYNMSFYSVDTAGSATQFAYGTASTNLRNMCLGDTSDGHAYVLTAATSASGTDMFGTSLLSTSRQTQLYKIDVDAMLSAWLSSGVQQHPKDFAVTVGPKQQGHLFSNASHRSLTPWAGSLTGSNDVFVANSSGQLFRVSLLDGGMTNLGNVTGMNWGGTNEQRPIHIAGPRWGNSPVDIFLAVARLDNGANALEYRVIKTGSWGYVDITPIGSGQTNEQIGIAPVPLSDTASMFYGGAPTHVSWYEPFQGGCVYVDLSTL